MIRMHSTIIFTITVWYRTLNKNWTVHEDITVVNLVLEHTIKCIFAIQLKLTWHGMITLIVRVAFCSQQNKENVGWYQIKFLPWTTPRKRSNQEWLWQAKSVCIYIYKKPCFLKTSHEIEVIDRQLYRGTGNRNQHQEGRITGWHQCSFS